MPQQPPGSLDAVRDGVYEGVQFIQPLDCARREAALRLGLGVCGSGRVNTPAEADSFSKETGWSQLSSNEESFPASALLGRFESLPQRTQ
jgi:hypothetical protein